MFRIIYSIFLIIYGFNFCATFDEVWKSYENSFINANREEIVVANVTTVHNFKSQLQISKWNTLSLGQHCYTVGLSSADNSKLEILFTTENKTDMDGFNISSKIFDLNSPIKQTVWFHQRKNIKDHIFLIVALLEKPEIIWYKLENQNLTHFWTWSLQRNITYIDTFQMGTKNALVISHGSSGASSIDMYGFNIKLSPAEYWFISKVPLQSVATSFALNSFEGTYYLSVPQIPQNSVRIFKFENNQFSPYRNITSTKVSNLISFEIGFKSFLAIDGLNAGIYQFTENGLRNEKIINSNLDGINFWLSIPVETYRDEVILLTQRILDHTSHRSLDVDLVTYNGVNFEEHEDVFCLLFGEERSSLSCLTDYDSKADITGTTYVSVNGKVGLLVPRSDGHSILFTVNIVMKQKMHPKSDEFERLQKDRERFQILMDGIKHQYEELEKNQLPKDQTDFKPPSEMISPMINISEETLQEIPPSSRYYQLYLKLQELAKDADDVTAKMDEILRREKTLEYDTVIINGEAKMENVVCDEVFTENIGEESASELINDIVRTDKISSAIIGGHKTFTDLTVEDLHFENMNGISSESFIRKTNDTVVINGNVDFILPVEAQNMEIQTGFINDIDFEKEFVDVDIPIEEPPLKFENINVQHTLQAKKVNHLDLHSDEINLSNIAKNLNISDQLDTVFLPGNVTITNINGNNLDEFVFKLCLRNIKCHIPNLVVQENVLVNGNAVTDYLNDLHFPREFVTLKNTDKITFSGSKQFVNNLEANSVRCKGLVNGLKTDDILTLSTPQYIPGNVTFRYLQVLDELNVNGSIRGEYPDKFLPNFTLQHTNQIKSNVEFENLEVLGSIFIKDNFNGINFEHTLNDIIYKTQKQVDIVSEKSFPDGFTVRKNLDIKSRKIGNLPIDSIVTKDTDQILDISTLNGVVSFDNLFVKELFAGHNITQLDQDIVKSNEDKIFSSKLMFKDPFYVNNLEIIDSLNEKLANEYLFHSGDRTIDRNITFENLNVENIFVQKNIDSETIANFDFEEFNDSVLSYTRDQNINCTLILENSEIDYLDVRNINGLNYSELFGQERSWENIRDLLDSNEVSVKDLEINGSVEISKINDKSLKSFGWLSQNISQKVLIIEDTVHFDTLNVTRLGGVNFNQFVKDLVYKDEENVEIESTVMFSKGMTVENLLETEKLNGIELENILRKYGSQEIQGPITIHGDVTLEEDSNITENINNVSLNDSFENVKIRDGAIVFKGDIIFTRLTYIKNLTLLGLANHKNLNEEILSHLVFLDVDTFLNGTTIFKDVVNIHGNLEVENKINNFRLSEFASRIASTTRNAEIEGPVKFAKSAIVHNFLKVQLNLDTMYLLGKNLTELSENAIFINEGLLEGNFTFEKVEIHGSLNTDFINEIDMKTIIPLKLNETIEYLKFGEISVVNDVNVGNHFNGLTLPKEYEKTVLKNVEQEISSRVVFLRRPLIRRNLYSPKINQMPVEKIVTTNTDQNLTATYIFNTKCFIRSNLKLNGLLNGVTDFDSWKKNGIKTFSNQPQVVSSAGDWFIGKSLSFRDNVTGMATINGYDMTKLADDIKYKKNYKLSMEHAIINDYQNMCVDLTYLHEQSKSQIYKFRHFEELSRISLPNIIQYVKQFEFRNKQYLLINDKNCHSYLMVFKQTAFVTLKRIESGHISDIVPVKAENTLYMVTTDYTQNEDKDRIICNVRQTNVWHFTEDDLKFVLNLETQELLQESMKLATFYGLNFEEVIEFQIDISKGAIRKHRKWKLHEDNAAFMPRELQRGLSIRTGQKLMYLNTPSTQELKLEEFDFQFEAVIRGKVTVEFNHFIPGRNDGDLAVVNVGTRSSRRSLLAVATHRETSVFDRLDLVEIYLDPFVGTMFHKLPTYKPSCLTSIEFNNGETLLAFLENGRFLQVYEYKGIEGFKHRLSARFEGSKLFLMTLPVEPYLNERKVLAIINQNQVILLEAVMSGNRIEEDLSCKL